MKNEEKSPKELIELQLSEHRKELDSKKREYVTLQGDIVTVQDRITFHTGKVVEFEEALKCME